MLIHLLLFLVKQAGKPPAAASARQRKQKLSDIVIECPACNTVSVSTEYGIDQAITKPAGWQRINRVFECGTCGKTLEAENHENDGTGVMRVRSWTCVKCQTLNSYLNFNCTQCRAWFTPPAQT